MLEEFPRKQLHFIIQNYGKSIINDYRRCRGLLKDLAPNQHLETNLILLVLEHRIIDRLIQETHYPVAIKIEQLAQKLHNHYGIQLEFAKWAIESWGIALEILPLANESTQSVGKQNTPLKLDEQFYSKGDVELVNDWSGILMVHDNIEIKEQIDNIPIGKKKKNIEIVSNSRRARRSIVEQNFKLK